MKTQHKKKNFPKKRTDIKSESLNLETLINKLFLSNLATKKWTSKKSS